MTPESAITPAPPDDRPRGRFFTSVDVGPIFGELVEIQLAEMAQILDSAADGGMRVLSDPPEATGGPDKVRACSRSTRSKPAPETGSSRRHPARGATRRSLLLQSSQPASRRSQPSGPRRTTVDARRGRRPPGDVGRRAADVLRALLANELLDALPVHQVVMRTDGLREVYVHAYARTASERAAAAS